MEAVYFLIRFAIGVVIFWCAVVLFVWHYLFRPIKDKV